MLSSRMWLATVTGPNRHNAGMTGAKIRGEHASPVTAESASYCPCGTPNGAFSGVKRANSALGGELQIKTTVPPVKWAETACESALSGFDARECGDYVMRS